MGPEHGTLDAMRSAGPVILGVVTLGIAAAAAADPQIQQPVLGGDEVPEGRWRDTAAVLFGGQQGCSGVLVAPTVVLTAGHCNDTSLDAVLVGTNSLSQPGRGEQIAVTRRIEYPSSWTSFDVTALVLQRASAIEPRAIATGWARLDIVDGAAVQLVGYGAIDRDATVYVDALQEVETTITDADCSDEGVGCNVAARPAGELGAGGMGRDTCPGDSGGPLYLRTVYGDFLAGLTSRAYDSAQFYCQDGGIYERPDAIVDWIEQETGVPVRRGPEPAAPPIEVAQGVGAETTIAPNDPVGTAHDYELAAMPLHGTAAVRGDGQVRYCANRDYTGADTVEVTIADRDAPARRLAYAIPVTVAAGTPPDDECTLEFEGGSGGCCSASTRPGGAEFVLAGLVGLALVRRRRRR
jgi:uncharacterized protein (TIGR03382 family)